MCEYLCVMSLLYNSVLYNCFTKQAPLIPQSKNHIEKKNEEMKKRKKLLKTKCHGWKDQGVEHSLDNGTFGSLACEANGGFF